MARRNLKVGDIKDVSGEVSIAGRDIIKNIKMIYQRALTAAEEAAQARKLESELLARGVGVLAQSLSAQASQGLESDSPYKGLLPYSLNESEIFYGRADAKKDLLNCIKRDTLTVLHAESGAGKSSLLHAGIAAQLIANGHLAIHLRPHTTDPVDFIKRMFLPELAQVPVLAEASLREFLRQVCEVLSSKVNLYLLLDQFEEFFDLLKKAERQPFLESLANCLNDPSLKVHWVLSLRAEALSDLAELESFGITPFKNMYRLNRLSRIEAQETIIEPARRYGIHFERALVDYILDTLTTNNEVMPTHLQLVCSALTDDLPEDKTLTLAYYTEHQGGTEGILRDYLKRQLEHLPAGEQALAWKVLRALISADRHRIVRTYDELIYELKTSVMSKKRIDTVLGRLVERRLLFTPPGMIQTFELAHDYLIKEIELEPQEQARKAAQELLDQETRTYQRHKTLLTAERLAVIEPYQDELRFSDESKKLFTDSQNTVLAGKRRRSTLLIGVSIAAIIIAVIMSILGVWGQGNAKEAAHQAATAQANAAEAQKQANIALARQLAAQAQSINTTRNSKQMIAVLLAVQSMKMFPSSEAAQVLLNNNFAAHPIARMTHDDRVDSVAFSPDGKYVASGSNDNTARVWELATGREVARMTHDYDVDLVAFSPDGKYVASGSRDGTVHVWEAATGKEVPHVSYDDFVMSVAFSPDGRYIVSGSDGTVRVWEVATGKEIAHMTYDDWIPSDSFSLDVRSVAFSPDSKYVVSGSVDNTVRVWEIATGKEVARMTHDNIVDTVAFSPDGKYVVSGSWDNTARVWEAETGNEVARLTHDDWITSVSFSPDSKYVVSGSDDKTARVWEVATGKEIARLTHDDSVGSTAFSPDSKYVVSASGDGTARVWEVATGKEVARMTHDSGVGSTAFSPDGKYVASGGGDGSVRVWEVATSKEVARLTHDSGVGSVAFSPDGKYVVSDSGDNTAHVWEADTGKEIVRVIQGIYLNTIAVSPNGKYVASGGCDHFDFDEASNRSSCDKGTALIWEYPIGREVARITLDDYVMSVAFSPDGKYLVIGSNDNTARVWEVATGKEIARMTHDDNVVSVAFSPDGKYVVSASGRDTIRMWEVETGKEVARITHNNDVDTLAFSPDGKYVVSGSGDGTARVWEVATGKEVARMIHDSGVDLVAFSPDGKYVASGSRDGTVHVWEATTGEEIARLTHDDSVDSVRFSPDGKYLVSGSRDNTVYVWEATTGKEIARLTHDDSVGSVRFSPDGKYLVSGSRDNTARVWEVATGKEVARMIHDSGVGSVAFSPDGKYVVSGSGDGTARIWFWQAEALIDNACSFLPRNLTRAEWKQYIGDALPYQAVCPNLPIEP